MLGAVRGGVVMTGNLCIYDSLTLGVGGVKVCEDLVESVMLRCHHIRL